MLRLSPLLVLAIALPSTGLAKTTLQTKGSATATPPPYSQQVTSLQQRSCPNDLFAVETPLWAPAFPSGFGAGLRQRLATRLDSRWFCPSSTCPGAVFDVEVEAILPDFSNPTTHPSIPALRRDGHRRFFQVQFFKTENGVRQRAPARDAQSCQVVSRIRDEAEALVGTTPRICQGTCAQPRVIVARECRTQPLDVAAFADPSHVAWALDRLRAQSRPYSTPIDVALVDGGIPTAMHSDLGVVSQYSLPSFYGLNPIEYHAHGAQMAALIKSLAPGAQIHSYRALDALGQATIGTLAHALDAAMFPNPTGYSRSPRVLNVSLGFPPSLTEPAELWSVGCKTWEDGLGESVRYAMAVAADLDAMGPPLITVAAGGNQILDQVARPTVLPMAELTTPCGTKASFGKGSAFLPAGLGDVSSCRHHLLMGKYPVYSHSGHNVLAVGASDYADRQAITTIRDAEPILAAPGQRVYVDHPAFPRAPGTLECAAADLGHDRGFEAPAMLTGSSVSAAFVTGAITRILSTRTERSFGAPWQAHALGRLVYLASEPVCRPLNSGVRRLSIGRLDQAVSLANTQCSNLFDCLADGRHSIVPFIDASAKSICAKALTQCLGHETAVASSCATTPVVEPGWPAGYATSALASSCSASYVRFPGSSAALPIDGTASHEHTELGGLQPTPIVVTCPDCRMAVSVTREDFILDAELSDAYDIDVDLDDPYLVFLDSKKNPIHWVPIKGAQAWKPGTLMKVTVKNPGRIGSSDDPTTVLLRGGSVALDLRVTTAQGRDARVLSPLAVDWF